MGINECNTNWAVMYTSKEGKDAVGWYVSTLLITLTPACFHCGPERTTDASLCAPMYPRQSGSFILHLTKHKSNTHSFEHSHFKHESSTQDFQAIPCHARLDHLSVEYFNGHTHTHTQFHTVTRGRGRGRKWKKKKEKRVEGKREGR